MYVRQLYQWTQDVMTMWVSLYFNVFHSLSSWTHWMRRCCVVHSKYCGKREHQRREDVVYLKTETKPFTQNAYLSRFLEGHLSPLHSRLAQESRMFRKHVKLMQVQLLKNMSRDFMVVFLHPTASHGFKWKSTLCDWFWVLRIKLYIHTWCCFVSNCLSKLIN